ncbi:MAG: hypothetical protein Q9198_004161 [Flavoplaca austrocitrina]
MTSEGDNTIPRALQYEVHRPAVTQTIDDRPTARETVLETFRLGQTLWVGASNPWKSLPQGKGSKPYMPPGVDTLEQFYVLYVPDLTRWDELDKTEDHKDELVALQAKLSLCVNTYHSNMTFGVMNTQLVSQEKNLNWQTGTETLEGNRFDTVTVTHGGEKFWMSEDNRESFYKHLSLQTFTGSASMRSEEPDGGGNLTENDIVRSIAESLYNDRAGIQGLSELLNNLAMSMSNAYATTCGIIRPKEMEEMAKKKYVRLESNGGQWQIMKAD